MTRFLSTPAILLALAMVALFSFAPRAMAQDHGSPKVEPSHSTPAANTTGAAHADDHHHDDGHGHGHETVGAIANVNQGLITGLTAIFVFVVVFGVIALKGWPAMVKGLDERSKKIKDEIQSAEMARKQAKDALEQYEASLKEARAEAQRMLEKARAQQQALHDEMKLKNEAEIVQMREKARRDIDAAKREALAELYATAGDIATNAAGKILRREVASGDTRRLMDETMAELSGARR